MEIGIAAALIALLISVLAAIYARRSADEAMRANDIGRLNALLALRTHYLALSQNQIELAKTLSNVPSGLQPAYQSFADLDEKLREVSREIDVYHLHLVSPRKPSKRRGKL